MATLYEQIFELTGKIKGLEDENQKLKKELHDYNSQNKVIGLLENILNELKTLNSKQVIYNNASVSNNTSPNTQKVIQINKKEDVFIPPINTAKMGLTANEERSIIIDNDINSNLEELQKINL
jgi:hypothetical protein